MFCKERCSKWYGIDGLKVIHRNCKFSYSYSESYETHNFKSKNFYFTFHFSNNLIKYGDVYKINGNERILCNINLNGLSINIFDDLDKLDKRLEDLIIYE